MPSRNVSVIHKNVCCLPANLDMIDSELSHHDIVCITESHIYESVINDNIELPGFQGPFRKDRNRYRGGVALYDTLTYVLDSTLSIFVTGDFNIKNYVI